MVFGIFKKKTGSSKQNNLKVSRFARTETIDVLFYRLVSEGSDDKVIDRYVGQTIQGEDNRYTQHKNDHKKNPKKKPWMNKVDGVFEIRINGIKGPFKMTPFEASVTEMYEMNVRGGIKNLANKHYPINEQLFNKFKE